MDNHPRRISFFGLEKTYSCYRADLLQAVDMALSTGTFVSGTPVVDLERQVAEQIGRRYAVAVNSGTDALVIALRAAGIGAGDEVIMSSLSFIASASPVLLVGATPVFVDIDEVTYLMDLEQVRLAIGPRTKAIIAVQLFGQCLSPEPLLAIAREHGIVLLEDAAQGFGAVRDARAAGTLGLISTLSFDPSKVLGGVTTGGMVLMDDEALYKRASQLRSHGWDEATGNFVRLGFNSRMSSLNAAVLSRMLQLHPRRHRAREYVAERYLAEFSGISNLVLPAIPAGSKPNFHKFVVRTADREGLRRHLANRGVDTRVHYAKPLHETDALVGQGRVIGELPRAVHTCEQVLSLPLHPEMTDDDIGAVIQAVVDFYR